MDRLQKKCFVASSGLHGVLVLVLVFGAAFFTPEKPKPVETLTMVPSKLIDDALSGGGGNPNIPRTDAKIQGDTLNPVPPQPVVKQPDPPKPRVEQPQPKPPQPKPPEPKVEPKKTSIPKEPVKAAAKPKAAPIELTPVNQSKTDRDKARKEAEAKARAAEQQRLAKAIGNLRKSMRQGFTSGTAVEVSGPGGEAYASYRSFVFAAYDNAWQVQPDVANEESVVVAKIVVHRTGRIISAQISQRSGNVVIDKSVQSALDRVDRLPPFPPGATDQERTFTIEFSLKAKRLIG